MQATRSDKYSGSEVIDFVRRCPLASLITSYHNRPYASHIPFLILEAEPCLVLGSYLNKTNKQWKHLEFEDVLLIFQPPASQIWHKELVKPGSITSEGARLLHVYGSCNVVHERAAEEALFVRMLRDFEPDLWQKWQSSTEHDREEILDKFVVFELKVEGAEICHVQLQPTMERSITN